MNARIAASCLGWLAIASAVPAQAADTMAVSLDKPNNTLSATASSLKTSPTLVSKK